MKSGNDCNPLILTLLFIFKLPLSLTISGEVPLLLRTHNNHHF